LLKEGKDIPPDLQEQIQAGKEATQSESEQIAALQAELNSHKEKVPFLCVFSRTLRAGIFLYFCKLD
jgi:hypothetical protein